ncbi:hypothetical protein CHU98_g2114 [Xylaria longipes]|nr:hypothetical protein CHU98_g2114 [Xylaria longipes]
MATCQLLRLTCERDSSSTPSRHLARRELAVPHSTGFDTRTARTLVVSAALVSWATSPPLHHISISLNSEAIYQPRTDPELFLAIWDDPGDPGDPGDPNILLIRFGSLLIRRRAVYFARSGLKRRLSYLSTRRYAGDGHIAYKHRNQKASGRRICRFLSASDCEP